TLVNDLHPGSDGSDPSYLTAVGSTLFFQANDGSHGIELWKSNGSSTGTVLVKDIRPGSAAAFNTYGNSLRFAYNAAVVSGTLVSAANDGSHGLELWKSNGTSTGTVMVKNIRPGSSGSKPAYLINVSGTLFFAANESSHGTELWKSDGS